MADLTEQVGNQVLKIGGNLVRSSAEFIEELMKAMEKNAKDDPGKYTLLQYMKEGNKPLTAYVKDGDVGDMKKYLDELGIANAFLSLPGNDSKLLMFRTEDRERVEFATKLLMADRGLVTEFERDEFLQMTGQDKLACFTELSYGEYELFREKAKDNGLNFAATVDEKGSINILYNIDDREKADMALKQMSWDLTGVNGEKYRIAYENKALAQETIKDLYEKEMDDVYIVDANDINKVLKVGKNGIALCEKYDDREPEKTNFADTEKIRVKDPEYERKLNEIVVKFERPVVLKLDEFKDRKESVKKKMPKLDKKWKEKEQEYQFAFEQKLGYENNYKVDNTQDVSSDKVRFTTLITTEIKLEEPEKKLVDDHVREAINLVKKYPHFIPKENMLNKIIDKAKNQQAINEAKRDMERALQKEMGKSLKRKGQDKDY